MLRDRRAARRSIKSVRRAGSLEEAVRRARKAAIDLTKCIHSSMDPAGVSQKTHPTIHKSTPGSVHEIDRDHAREHERKSEFCFEVGNETRNPRRRGRLPIK